MHPFLDSFLLWNNFQFEKVEKPTQLIVSGYIRDQQKFHKHYFDMKTNFIKQYMIAFYVDITYTIHDKSCIKWIDKILHHNEITKQLNKHTINGFIRESEKSLFKEHPNNSFYIIPQCVINLCFLFYKDNKDEFDPDLCSEDVTITHNNRRIYYGFLHHTCYGMKVISPVFDETYIWKFIIISTVPQELVIGIIIK